jgi:hypothetical protein
LQSEIASSREHNNPLIASRAHELRRVFCANSPASDLLVIGMFKIDLKDGQSVEIDFNTRFVVDQVEDRVARLKFVQVWTDPTDMMAAMEKAKKREIE